MRKKVPVLFNLFDSLSKRENPFAIYQLPNQQPPSLHAHARPHTVDSFPFLLSISFLFSLPYCLRSLTFACDVAAPFRHYLKAFFSAVRFGLMYLKFYYNIPHSTLARLFVVVVVVWSLTCFVVRSIVVLFVVIVAVICCCSAIVRVRSR